MCPSVSGAQSRRLWNHWTVESSRSEQTDPKLAKLVVAALVTAVVLCLAVLLLLTSLGDAVVHN